MGTAAGEKRFEDERRRHFIDDLFSSSARNVGCDEGFGGLSRGQPFVDPMNRAGKYFSQMLHKRIHLLRSDAALAAERHRITHHDFLCDIRFEVLGYLFEVCPQRRELDSTHRQCKSFPGIAHRNTDAFGSNVQRKNSAHAEGLTNAAACAPERMRRPK